MALVFTEVDLGPYRVDLPSVWTWRRSSRGEGVHALHIQIGPEIMVDLQVLSGLGDAEGIRQLVAMHALAGARAPAPPSLRLPVGETSSLAVRLPGGPGKQEPIDRELQAIAVGGDLLVAMLTGVVGQRRPPHDLTTLRRWVELLLRRAVSSGARVTPHLPPPPGKARDRMAAGWAR